MAKISRITADPLLPHPTTAEAKVAEQSGAASAYGGGLNGSSEAGRPANLSGQERNATIPDAPISGEQV
jgi:hypothetical protein